MNDRNKTRRGRDATNDRERRTDGDSTGVDRMSDTKWVCCPKCDSEIEVELDLGNAQMNTEGDETVTFTVTGECQNDIVTDEQTGEWEYCAHEVEVTVYYTESHIDIDYNEE